MSQTVANGRYVPESVPNATISEKNTPKTLRTAKLETAAVLVSEHRLTDQQIADSLAVSRRQLARWKCEEAFRARVLEIAREVAQEAVKRVLDGQERRIAERESGFGADVRRIEARFDRRPASPIARTVRRVLDPEPEQGRPKSIMDVLLRPARDYSICLDGDIFHRHVTR